jgi:hypothetical protein
MPAEAAFTMYVVSVQRDGGTAQLVIDDDALSYTAQFASVKAQRGAAANDK